MPMKLLTKDILNKLPPLYSNEDKTEEDTLVVTKFFTPDSNWTWYVTEGSLVDEDGYFDTDKPKVDTVFFGLVNGLELELGNFSLSEIQTTRGPLGLHIERDLWWEPISLAEVRRNIAAGRAP